MNANYRKVPAKFGPETRFELTPVVAPLRALREAELERLKRRLLVERLETVWDPRMTVRVRRAANEAVALAWVTPYPMLVFPGLFEEKVEEERVRAERQEDVLERSRELLMV